MTTHSTKSATMFTTSTSNYPLTALSIFFGSVLFLVPVLCVEDHHPEWAGYNCTGNVGKGTVPHFLTRTLEDKLVCCHPTTCNGGTIKFCIEDNGTDMCVPCPRNERCNYKNVTSENMFMMPDDICAKRCARENAVPEVVFYASSHTKKAGDDVRFQPTIDSDYLLTGFIWSFVNTTGSYVIASSLTGISNRRKYKVGTFQSPYLSIINIEPQDHGTYQLIVGNLIGPSNVTDVVLNVTAKPIVSMTKVSDNVDAGTTYVMSCKITGNLEVIQSTFLFEDIRGNVTEINSNVSPIGLMTHTILKTSSSNSGKYTCQAENSEGKAESTLHLTVDIPPEMYSPFAGRVMDYTIGDNVSISLWVSQTPDLNDLNCKHQDSPSQQMSLGLPYNVSNVGMSFNYTIMNVQADAKGTYVCTAINRLGASYFSVEINVNFQKTTPAPLVTSEEQHCEWLYGLTTGFAIIVIGCGCITALLRVFCYPVTSEEQHCENKPTNLDKIVLAGMIIFAIVVLIAINIAEKDCSKDTVMMEAIFCVFLFLSAVFEIWYFCKVSYILQNKKESNRQDEQMQLQPLEQST